MAERIVTARIIRPGQPVKTSDDWATSTAEERIEAVWMLTRLCMEWTRDGLDEPRLQRSVVRIQRAPR